MFEDKKNPSYLIQGNHAFLHGQYEEAIEFLTLASKQNPALTEVVKFNIELSTRRAALNSNKTLTIIDADNNLTASIFELELRKLKKSKAFTEVMSDFWHKNSHAIDASISSIDSTWKPLISIIMPAYNRADIIKNSVMTVLEQSYEKFELIICDDGSTDDTRNTIKELADSRIQYTYQENQGAAAARNTALALARGELIAYLDTDNFWHPEFLSLTVKYFSINEGRSALYFDFIDYRIDKNNAIHIYSTKRPEFNHETLLEKPFIDLNTFVHKRELFDSFGGFDPRLSRRQDYDLILKYTWLRDPLHVKLCAALYQRNDNLEQITKTNRNDQSPINIINSKVIGYLSHGLPLQKNSSVKKVSVIIWDICRNHFSKPFSVAESLSENYEVEIISFDFFNEGVFEPLRNVTPPFETKYFKGADFPDFFSMLRAGIDAVTGDVMYVVKPRLASLGLALLANYERGIPFALEINDLETVVNSPKEGDQHMEISFDDVDLSHKDLLNPYSELWSAIFDPISKSLPTLITHNQGLDSHYGNRTMYMRNLKNEDVYDPKKYDREQIRNQLGFHSDDRIILFGGLIRKHKGIFELVELVEKLKDKRYKLLFVGSRPTPDQAKLVEQFKDVITVLPPQDREGMAKINYAADLVILWLNPDVPASHYQFPYKASDAFAMETPVIANHISDLGDLGRQGYLTTVPFGDWAGMVSAIHKIFEDKEYRNNQVSAARRLFLRQFSFNAARSNFEIISRRLMQSNGNTYPTSNSFAKRFDEFYRHVSGSNTSFLKIKPHSHSLQLLKSSTRIPENFGEFELDCNIYFFDGKNKTELTTGFGSKKIMVLLFAENSAGALQAARLLIKRSNYDIEVAIILCGRNEHPNLSNISLCTHSSKASFFVLCDEFTFPCRDWLEHAYTEITQERKFAVIANDGSIFSSDTIRVRPQYMMINAATFIMHIRDIPSNTSESPWKLISAKIIKESDFTYARKFLLANLYDAATQTRAFTDGSELHLIDIKNFDKQKISLTNNICVVMPCINHQLGLRTADLLQSKSGISADYVIAVDTKRQGFIKTLNQVAKSSSAEYVVYLAEDAYPGENWLKIAYETLKESGKGLLAFNCGKWHGRVSAFGMVKSSWVKQFYNGDILYQGYKSHRADNEITLIARAVNSFIYAPDSVLLENDPSKDFKANESDANNFSNFDKKLFKERFKNGFSDALESGTYEWLFDEYFDQKKVFLQKKPLSI